IILWNHRNRSGIIPPSQTAEVISLPRGEGVSRRLTEEGFTGIPEGSLPCAKGGGISAGNDGGIVILSNKKTGGYYPPLHFQLSTINFQFEKNPPVTFGASPL
ncbi:MAG: hypothetical protein IJE28_08645, partial [Oscillospiraceae bacterium]|nr:hypothetical protein [Oscillospiraceae bacterium]